MSDQPLTILFLNGPNLQLLGMREPGIYGTETLAAIEARCQTVAKELGVVLDCRQSNHEGTLVDWIDEMPGRFDGLVINPGAYTHTSVALRDAVAAVRLPVVEVHISNIFQREDYRHRSYLSEVAWAVVSGMGADGYEWALRALVRKLQKSSSEE
ncbi:MAG: type II 3-dehydroquinate dehydratase [Victivallales bacterium]|nr:type II 3-dehydroquinate dehydratase [Victivallales bacterium]